MTFVGLSALSSEMESRSAYLQLVLWYQKMKCFYFKRLYVKNNSSVAVREKGESILGLLELHPILKLEKFISASSRDIDCVKK